MKLRKLLLGADKPNETQLRLYSETAADLAKAILLASGAIIFVPSEQEVRISLAVAGIFTATVLFIAASRFLKGVKEK